MPASISKLLYSWLFVDPSGHHYTTQTSKFNNFWNRSSTMLDNVFYPLMTNCVQETKFDNHPKSHNIDFFFNIHSISRGEHRKIYLKFEPHLVCSVSNLLKGFVTSWEPEGHYHCPKMICWEPEGHYHHRLCTAIVPFWFSTEHLCILIVPFWPSTDDMYAKG